MRSDALAISARRLQALLNRPNWALETWGVAVEKYLSALEDYHKEKYLREEAELLGRQPPVDYVTKVANADPKLALSLLHDQNPELDIENLQEQEDLEVALAVLNIV